MSHPIVHPTGERIVLDVVPPRAPCATSFVYVHGLGSHRGGEKALFLERNLVGRGFGFARVDLRGHGASDGKLESITLTRLIEDVEAVLAHLASGAGGAPPRRVIPIGASLGALPVAWRNALAPRDEPLSIPGQVLIAPAFRIVERYLAALGELGRARWQREGVYRFVGPWFQFDLRWDVVEDHARYPHERLVRGTRVPTLLLHGTKDESAPYAASEEFAAAVPRGIIRLVPIPGGDHRLTAVKERLRDEIVEFASAVTEGELACAP